MTSSSPPSPVSPQGPGSPGLFHVVLVEPEIPNNTGNIGRTCVATGCALHLVRPLGFDTSEKACRRAGLDYWPRLRVREHDSWDLFERDVAPPRLWLLTTKTTRSVFDVTLLRGDALVFGKETAGLGPEFLSRYPDRLVSLPMMEGERSLNLATAACTVIYEGIRQLLHRGEIRRNANGRLEVPSTST
ncbi:MAG: tRNA (uridine(34)/cytosine(34)/5-carboxymethylaminomethyluridine(34)-2'-O)-methyltransferase TrmL [Tepidisphaera sp.]|nr:tRNA (uridine(34)/cytosine(34)/5-carboxymethylaminomethyluridine(34)-2'-O)-methyltransferase TrmL [Tepidisphaera sp.]